MQTLLGENWLAAIFTGVTLYCLVQLISLMIGDTQTAMTAISAFAV